MGGAADIRAGDVLLFHGNSPVSWAIRTFDGTDVNHAAVALDGETIAEATGSGVERNPLRGAIDGNLRTYVRRLPGDVDRTLVTAKANEYVLARVPYAYQQILLLAVLSIVRRLPIHNPLLRLVLRPLLDHAARLINSLVDRGRDLMICSELVYRCYDESGDPGLRLEIVAAAPQLVPGEQTLLEWASGRPEPELLRTAAEETPSPEMVLAQAHAELEPAIAAFAMRESPSEAVSLTFTVPAPTRTQLEEEVMDEQLHGAAVRFRDALLRGPIPERIAPALPGSPWDLFRTVADFITPGDLLARCPTLETVFTIEQRASTPSGLRGGGGTRMEDTLSMGWLPDHPDYRDYSADEQRLAPPEGETRRVPELLDMLGVAKPSFAEELPGRVDDLIGDFSPVEDQKNLGSCTANAAAGLIEFFERRASGQYVDASRIFIYKATRNLMGVTGDTGAFLRTTMQAMVAFGAPPESYWPYDVARFEVEPTAFCYAFAQNYKALQYYRLDPPGTDRETLLNRIKTNLHARLPSMFGFTVFSSIRQPLNPGEIPFPGPNESRIGGHAVVACGYDDAKEIANPGTPDQPTVGALMIRNSWGSGWGENGYGWLPYEYVKQALAIDWWSLLKSAWVDVGVFGAR